MKSPMLPADHQAAVQRALNLGRSGDPAALAELIAMLRTPSHEVQRLAVSAIGKLAEFGADAKAAVVALGPLALTAHNIGYRYDAKFRIIGEFQIRPDFYLPDLDVYIEYWGLDTPQYKMSMYKKQTLYQQEGKRLISIYPSDLPELDAMLERKLRLFGYSAGKAGEQS